MNPCQILGNDKIVVAIDGGREKGLVMFGKLKKNGLTFSPQPFTIRWYPSGRSCVNTHRRKPKPQQMPPLMVRKADWRR